MPHETNSGSRQGLGIADKERLAEAVHAHPVLHDPHQRQMVLNELREEFGQFDPVRHGGSTADTWALVSMCIRLDAVPTLVTILKIVGGATTEWYHLNDVVEELFSQSTDPNAVSEDLDRRIRALLVSISSDTVAAALRHERFPAQSLPISDNGDEYDTAESVYSALLTQQESLLIFLELVAHQLEDYDMVEMHRLADMLAQSWGRSISPELCRAAQLPPPGPADEQELNRSPGDSVSPDTGSNGDETEADEDDGDDAVNRTRVKPGRADASVYVPPQVWGGVPPRNKNFTGREDILALIQRTLGQHSQSALVPQALHGLGGIGKSQMAIEYAHRFQDEYQLVWWIQADDERSIRRSLVSLAKRLGLPESEDVQDTVDTVLDALRRGDPHSRWLLIYDNTPEPSVVGPYLPSGLGHVLITSRSRSWASESNAIEVDVFSPAESVRLIRTRWDDLSEDDALALAEGLGHLPLALEQAVAMHEQTGIPLDEYRRALDRNPSQILAEGIPANYSKSVAATLNLAFASVRESSSGAAYLLRLCAFLSSQPIALPLLTRGRAAQPDDEGVDLRDDIMLRRAVRDLGRFALVQLDVGRDLLRVHNLVRALIRDAMPEDERAAIERHAHAVLASANPGRPDEPDTWAQHAQIAPHLVPAGLVYSLEAEVRQVVLDQIRYHYAIGDYAESRNLGESTVDTWRSSCGEDDELTLIACRHLANSMRVLGDYEAARELNRDTLDRMVRTLGPDHEHSLATTGIVAADLRLAGEFTTALELDEHNLARHREVLGDRDPHTMRAIGNLAVDHRLLGQFTTSHALDQEAIGLKTDIYGEDHPRTLFSYMCLVRDLFGLGEFERGLAVAVEKLPLHEQALPPNHGDLLLARRNLAILLRKTGHNQEALQRTRELHDACRRKFGRSHEHTLSALVSLSNALRVTGDVDGALRYGQRALTIYREVFDDGHPFTLACQVNVAIVLQALDRLDEARALNDDALALLVAKLGEDHPHTLCAANTKANGLAAAGEHRKARELSEDILRRSRRVRGDDHPYTLVCAANHALDLEATGDGVIATELRRETFDRFRATLGFNHPETLNAGTYQRMESDVEVPAS